MLFQVILYFCTATFVLAAPNQYIGTLNGTLISALVEFGDDKAVRGEFYRADDQQTVFSFVGTNALEGRMAIFIIQNGNSIGTAELKKILTQASVIWSGRILFNDGNSFPFELQRLRAQ
jgi:hypothetical protein